MKKLLWLIPVLIIALAAVTPPPVAYPPTARVTDVNSATQLVTQAYTAYDAFLLALIQSIQGSTGGVTAPLATNIAESIAGPLFIAVSNLAYLKATPSEINVLDFGASTNIADNGPAFTAAFNAVPRASAWKYSATGARVVAPPGVYQFETAAVIPQDIGMNGICSIEGFGARLETTNDIVIFDRWPTNLAEVEFTEEAKIYIRGFSFRGYGAGTNATGIRASASYLGKIEQCDFWTLGAGIDAYFTLGLAVNGNSFTYAPLRIQGATNDITGLGYTASTAAAQSNHSTVRHNRFRSYLGQPYNVMLIDSSNMVVEDNIFEGANPINNVYVRGNEPVTFRNLHVENAASEAFFRFENFSRLVTVTIDGFQPNQCNLPGALSTLSIIATNCNDPTFNIVNWQAVDCYPQFDASSRRLANGTLGQPGQSGWNWNFTSARGQQDCNWTDSKYWVGGIVPTNMTINGQPAFDYVNRMRVGAGGQTNIGPLYAAGTIATDGGFHGPGTGVSNVTAIAVQSAGGGVGAYANMLGTSENVSVGFGQGQWQGAYFDNWIIPTTTPNTIVDPRGTTNGTKLVWYVLDPNGIGQTVSNSTVAISAKQLVFSVWLKAPTNCNIFLMASDDAGYFASPYYTLTTNWTRYSFTFTTRTSTRVSPGVVFQAAGAGRLSDEFHMFGPQLEYGSMPSQYVRTPTTAPIAAGIGIAGDGRQLFNVSGTSIVGNVTTALNARNSSNFWGQLSVSNYNNGTGATTSTYLRGDGTWVAPGGVTLFNNRSGNVSLLSLDVTTALGYTPVDPATLGTASTRGMYDFLWAPPDTNGWSYVPGQSYSVLLKPPSGEFAYRSIDFWRAPGLGSAYYKMTIPLEVSASMMTGADAENLFSQGVIPSQFMGSTPGYGRVLIDGGGSGSWISPNWVLSFQGRTGNVTLSTTDISTTLGYTPADRDNLMGDKITSGQVPPARLGTGPRSADVFLNGLGAWAPATAGSTGTYSIDKSMEMSDTAWHEVARWAIGDTELRLVELTIAGVYRYGTDIALIKGVWTIRRDGTWYVAQSSVMADVGGYTASGVRFSAPDSGTVALEIKGAGVGLQKWIILGTVRGP